LNYNTSRSIIDVILTSAMYNDFSIFTFSQINV